MEEFEPKKKTKIITKQFLAKYSYVFVLAVLLIGGISFGYTFFTQNRKIASGIFTTANLSINFGNLNINATGLSVPATDQEGLSEFSKSITITNSSNTDGIVELSLTRTSGLNLSDLRYAIVVNGAIQEIADVPTSGKILKTAIMGNETVNVEVRLWPKTTYSGNGTTFVGEIDKEIRYLGNTAANSISNPAGKYVNFNCSSTCEVWQIVKIEDGRLVLTRQSDYSGATSRTNSNRYNSSLTFNDNSMITSVSTDNKNVYLAKTVKIDGGTGTQTDPYTLINNDFREPDKKVIAQITYKDNNNTTVGTQNIYYNETNYISQVLDDPDFSKWTDGTNNYELGDTITFTSDANLTAVVVPKLNTVITNLCNDSNVTYVKKYSSSYGTTMDTPNGSGTKDVCYYTSNNALSNSNVILGDYCWQIVRTTDNGGVRMIYNGVAENNKCETTRTATKGINGQAGTTQNMNAASLYGRSYDYDLATGVFTIGDSTGLPTSWNDSNYRSLIGTYTCLSGSNTCSTLYYVGSYYSNTSAYVSKYTIGNVAHYSQIGTSSFNANSASPALVGYMFNTEYDYKSGSKSGEYYTNAVWENGAYTLSNGNSGTAPDGEHHYICDNDCTKVRYYYYVINSSYYYVLLENGKTIEDALAEMINYKANANDSDENINVYDSAIKGYLENWYKKNLTAYTSYLDQASVYCNDRSISELGGWNPSGTSITGSASYLQFKHNSGNRDLNCVNETDRFAVTNSKAKLNYPVGLLTEPERYIMTANYVKTGQNYRAASPLNFSNGSASVLFLNTSGGRGDSNVSQSYGVRPVITLKKDVTISSGDGTYTDPYIIDTSKIPSCPDCKFTFFEDGNKFTTWNTYNTAPTVITSGLYDDYRDLVTATGKNHFIGVKLNSNNEVTNVYGCAVKDNVPFCVEGTVDGSTYSTNKATLTQSNLFGNTCTEFLLTESDGYDLFRCTQSDVGVDTYSVGDVFVNSGNNNYCAILSDGSFTCYST